MVKIDSSVLDDKQLRDDTIVDDPKRVKYSKSFFQKIFHFNEKRKLDHEVHLSVLQLFQKRYKFQDSYAFKRIWKRLGKSIWNMEQTLTLGKLKSIDKAFRDRLVYHGKGICQPSSSPSPQIDKDIQQVVQVLLHGGRLSLNLLQKKMLKAIFITKDTAMLDNFRLALQDELNSLAEIPPKNPQEEVMWRAFAGNVIALLPFTYPRSKDTITLPILENGSCRKVKYSIEVLPLHYPGASSPMSALAMLPEKNQKGPPLLSFIGTTFPAGEGHLATVLSDFTPKHSVGELVYNTNKGIIENWLKDKTNVVVYGVSLGGAMAFHTYRHQHEKLSKVEVYNPPGLYPNCWKQQVDSPCHVNIYCQTGDLVSHLGEWPTGKNVTLYSILQHQNNVKENLISSHARAFTGCESVTIIKEDPKKVNTFIKRKALTRAHQWLGPLLVYLPIRCSMWICQQANKIKAWSRKFFRGKS